MASLRWLAFPDKRLTVNGLAWFEETAPHLWRLPPRMKRIVRRPVWQLSMMPSGGRIRFSTDSTSLAVRVRYKSLGHMNNMHRIGQAGIDCYIDGRFIRPVWPMKNGRSDLTFFEGYPRTRKEITLYLPLYHPVEILALGFDRGARIAPPRPFAVAKPVVFYGTSITQGGCASHPGMSYQAIIGRMLNVDFANLGFSGEGRGEPEMAAAVAEVDASCFVFDFGQNSPTVAEFAERYGPFIDVVRRAHQKTPILCNTPIFATRTYHQKADRKRFDALSQVARRTVAERIAAGDDNLRLIEGLMLLNQREADATDDGIHPNDLGFQREAERWTPMIASALGMRWY